MKKKKNKFISPLIAVLIILAAIGVVKHFHIKNFHVIEPSMLYTSGQPSGMDYTRLLYKYHIAAFVNVRSADEHRDHNWYNEEVTWMRENSANYIELPMEKYSVPDSRTVAKFFEIMSEPTNLPVLIHGGSGEMRVSMLAGAWLLKSGRGELEEVAAKAEKINGQKLTEEEFVFLKSFTE